MKAEMNNTELTVAMAIQYATAKDERLTNIAVSPESYLLSGYPFPIDDKAKVSFYGLPVRLDRSIPEDEARLESEGKLIRIVRLLKPRAEGAEDSER